MPIKFALVLCLMLFVPTVLAAQTPALLPDSTRLIAVNEQQVLIAEIVIHGNRLVPTNTIKALMSIKPGDVYDPDNLEHDLNSLWNSGYFQDVRIEREQSERGWVIHIYLKEKPTAR